MIDYFKPTEYVIDRLWFDYLEGRYQGRGIMTWKPDEGFHIDAFLERHGRPLPKRMEFGKVEIISKRDIHSIRMKMPCFPGYDWAIARTPFLDRQKRNIYEQKRLSIDINRVIFFQQGPPIYSGYALYSTDDSIYFPDQFIIETKIKDRIIRQESSLGINYKDEDIKVDGRSLDKSLFELSWNLQMKIPMKRYCWDWAVAAQDSLSILTGQAINFLFRRVNRGSLEITEIRKRYKVDVLDLLSLFDFDRIEKELFIKMTKFFIQNNSNVEICRNIFKQMLEASRQHSWQARELLLATILEAALRNIEHKPFKQGGTGLDIKQSIEKFRQSYLSEKWIDICKKVPDVHDRLRQRNAHPDWLYTQGGALSDEEREKSLDDMIFLSRFYGYIILALAGFKNLEPKFPLSHKQWGPIMTVFREEQIS